AIPVPISEGGTASTNAAAALASLGGTTLAAVNQAYIAGQLMPQTAAEITAGIVPTSYQYAPGDPRRYGALGLGGDDTAALKACFAVNQTINFPGPAFTFGISANLNYSIGN